MDCRLTFRLFVLVLTAEALEIGTPNNQVFDEAVGEHVRLDCQFTTAPEDEGHLEIEWTVKSVRHPMEKAELLMYVAGHIYEYYEPLKGRVYFQSDDPGKGDAGIQLLRLTPSDSGIYYCQVKKAPAIRNIKAVLRVLQKPSKPRCSCTEGAGDVGKTVVLHCASEEGAPPIKYHWSRVPPWKLLPPSALMDETSGTMTIQDARESDAGTWVCTAKNRVGMETCLLEVSLTDPPALGTIIAAVTSTVAIIGVISSITFFIIRRLRKKPEEVSNEILEDATPPKSRR
ncbi:coxsackievirus and adenovirus receptor homolog, partial [Plectropomus leopardus]|uniref:coxsackievirus and adenovirus receptor homolog n=1 Tax=Plectropomus leopardus TaxID=160734 RepID=UPI001C4A8A88